jgi:hypothetical protein
VTSVGIIFSVKEYRINKYVVIAVAEKCVEKGMKCLKNKRNLCGEKSGEKREKQQAKTG